MSDQPSQSGSRRPSSTRGWMQTYLGQVRRHTRMIRARLGIVVSARHGDRLGANPRPARELDTLTKMVGGGPETRNPKPQPASEAPARRDLRPRSSAAEHPASSRPSPDPTSPPGPAPNPAAVRPASAHSPRPRRSPRRRATSRPISPPLSRQRPRKPSSDTAARAPVPSVTASTRARPKLRPLPR